MKKYAAVFPGQGSQSVGMFADFMDNEIVAKTYPRNRKNNPLLYT